MARPRGPHRRSETGSAEPAKKGRPAKRRDGSPIVIGRNRAKRRVAQSFRALMSPGLATRQTLISRSFTGAIPAIAQRRNWSTARCPKSAGHGQMRLQRDPIACRRRRTNCTDGRRWSCGHRLRPGFGQRKLAFRQFRSSIPDPFFRPATVVCSENEAPSSRARRSNRSSNKLRLTAISQSFHRRKLHC